MTGPRQRFLSTVAGLALAAAPVAPASAAVPLLALLGHLIVGHHAAGAAVRLAHAPFAAASAAAFVAQQSLAPYAYYPGAVPGYYGGASVSDAPAPYYPAPYYAAPYHAAPYYAAPYYVTVPGYYAAPQRYYPRAAGYGRVPGSYAGRVGGGYYRPEVSYLRSFPRAYEAPRRYGAPRASYRSPYTYAARGGRPGYRR
ncbi:MAG TPA: hypothetical protein VMD49_00140 [Steroidobacteraceae bacterium]|nr:hypothetical protein [Steroidobacteraceae bacterium]